MKRREGAADVGNGQWESRDGGVEMVFLVFLVLRDAGCDMVTLCFRCRDMDLKSGLLAARARYR